MLPENDFYLRSLIICIGDYASFFKIIHMLDRILYSEIMKSSIFFHFFINSKDFQNISQSFYFDPNIWTRVSDKGYYETTTGYNLCCNWFIEKLKQFWTLNLFNNDSLFLFFNDSKKISESFLLITTG